MPANCIIAQPLWLTQTDPRIATVSVSGGFWNPDLPVTNLLQDRNGAVARTENCATGSASFWVDLGTSRDILVAAIPRSNASPSATVRVRAYSDKGLGSILLADTGVTPYFPDLYPFGTVDWGHPSIFSTSVDRETALLFPQSWIYVFNDPVLTRYCFIEIEDPANLDGYIELSRFILASGYRPEFDFNSEGATLKIVDPSEVQRSYGGRVYGERRQKYRVAAFTFGSVDKDEAFVNIHDMNALQGTTGEVFFIWDYTDIPNRSRSSFVGRFSEMSALESSNFFNRVSSGFQIEERIG